MVFHNPLELDHLAFMLKLKKKGTLKKKSLFPKRNSEKQRQCFEDKTLFEHRTNPAKLCRAPHYWLKRKKN